MKFKDILLEYLIEQHLNIVPPEDDDEDLELEPDDENDDELDPNDHDGEEPDPNVEPKPKKEKQLTPAQLLIHNLKLRWKQQNPGLTEQNMDDAIDFFNRKKNNLRPINVPGQRNMPEIFSLKQRFPNFPAENMQRLRDINEYSWEQIEYFIDRFAATQAAVEFNFEIEGDTKEARKASAMSKWLLPSKNKIVDENGIIVHKIEGVDESMALGRLQHILAGESNDPNWCVTNTPQDRGGNLYSSYRNRRAFYFVLDRNREERDEYYISALQAVDPYNETYKYERDYVITPKQNGDRPGKRWYEIETIYPQLRGKQELFKFFGPTFKEKENRSIDRIVFRARDEYDFAIQTPELQGMYVRANRAINSPRAFQSMSEELQTEYVRRTTLDNYRDRFKCENPTEPFGMINILSNQDSKTLDFVLKAQCRIPDGINAIKSVILGIHYRRMFVDSENKNNVLFGTKDGENRYGIIDLSPSSSFNWVKPMSYMMSKPTTLIDNNRKLYTLLTFTHDDGMAPFTTGQDVFYWLFPNENYYSKDKTFPGHLKGRYMSGEDGNRIKQEYRKLGE